MDKLSRMVSIDLNAPSLSSGVYHTKTGGNPLSEQNKKNRLKLFNNNNEASIYDKYFHKRIARPVSFIQLFLAVTILICQLSTTGLLIGPATTPSGTALSTSDRVGAGIWASIVTTLAVGATFWALNKTNFCRLHASMLLHFSSLAAYIILEYLLLMSTIPTVQERIYFLQENIPDDPVWIDSRRQLLNSRNIQNADLLRGGVNVADLKNSYVQMQAELYRLYAALVLSIVMALAGIFQLLLHFLMTLKTGRAINLGKTYFEGRLSQLQTIGESWKNRSFRFGSKDSTLPKLERSDALPPPPYESGYFHPSLNA